MDIDFVVPWVDSTDPEWIAEYRKYRKEEHLEDKARFRNWDIFHYWFRAVENYAPWVHKVFLVTNGKFPDWFNPDRRLTSVTSTNSRTRSSCRSATALPCASRGTTRSGTSSFISQYGLRSVLIVSASL